MTHSAITPPPRRGPVGAVVFDVGETLVNETTEYNAWADWLGIPRHTFSAMFGAVIARGKDYREVFQVFRPGFNLEIERDRRVEAGQPESFGEADLYPDARGCLATLKEQGYLVGIAGNQTARAGEILRGLNFAADFVATSDDWKAEKPTQGFFSALIESCGMSPDHVAYVGDRLDNDINPALDAGLVGVFVRRGPWGYQHQHDPAAARAHIRIPDLAQLSEALAAFNAAHV